MKERASSFWRMGAVNGHRPATVPPVTVSCGQNNEEMDEEEQERSSEGNRNDVLKVQPVKFPLTLWFRSVCFMDLDTSVYTFIINTVLFLYFPGNNHKLSSQKSSSLQCKLSHPGTKRKGQEQWTRLKGAYKLLWTSLLLPSVKQRKSAYS